MAVGAILGAAQREQPATAYRARDRSGRIVRRQLPARGEITHGMRLVPAEQGINAAAVSVRWRDGCSRRLSAVVSSAA